MPFDPFDPETIADPFPAYRALRDEAPVYRCEARGFWVVSRYDDVTQVLRDHGRFSSGAGVGSEWRPVPMMISVDPPDHTLLRRLVQREFTPRAIAGWDERVTGLVDDTLDAFVERGGGDLAAEVAYPIPIGVIADMLDVPTEHRLDFKRWSDDTIDALGGGLDAETSARVELSIIEFAQYFAAVIARRRLAPGRDLLSLLVDPSNGDLGVAAAKILAPGDPSRSLLSIRPKRLGAGRMPPLASRVVDPAGAAAIDAFISSIATCP